MDCFTDIQEHVVTKKPVQVLIQCVIESIPFTIQALKQVVLQLAVWKKRSKKLAGVYKLFRKFFEELKKQAETNISVEEIPKELIKLCCKVCSSTNYLVQLRSAHILRIMYENYGKAIFDKHESLRHKLEEACLVLIKGKASLKEMAIKLAPAFDNSGAKKNKWTAELLRILGVCKTVEYRKAALQYIPLTKHTLPFILKKTRDVKDLVRCAVYAKLQKEEITLEKLKLEERYEVAYNGLSDRSEIVRKACEDYLKWCLQSLTLMKQAEIISDKERRMTKVITPIKPSIEFVKEDKTMKFLELFNVTELINNEDYCTLLHLLSGFLLMQYNTKEWLSYYKTYVKPKLEQLVNVENSWYHSGRQEAVNLLVKRQAVGIPRATNEQIVFLRYICEHWNINRVKYGEAIHEIEEVLPEITIMRRVLKIYKEENNIFVVNELLLMLAYYNVAEPKVNQQILLTIDDILIDTSLEDTSFNLLAAGDIDPARTRQYSDIEEIEGINTQYTQLVNDQLDIQRRDVIVRRRQDLVTVSIRVLAQVMSNDPNQYKNVLKMRISDLIEQVEEYKEKIGEKLEKLKDEENKKLEQELGKLIVEESYPLMRALKLAVGLLQTCKFDKEDKFLQEVQVKLVREAFEKYNDNELINFLATEYLGLYSIIDLEKCKEFFPFFRSLVKGIGTTQTLKGIAALKAIFDFFLAYGKHVERSLKDESATPISHNRGEKSILKELQCLLYSPNKKLRFLMYESFSRLLFCDKLPKAETFLISLFILLGDPKESTLSPAMQIIALAFNRYTRLSLSRCKKMSNAIVLLNLVWTKANINEKSIAGNCLLRKFIGYKYHSVVPPLVYRLTHAYIETGGFVNLQESKENPLVELIIMLLSDLDNDIEVFPYIKVCLGICLRFVDLEIILPEVLIALHIKWETLMRSVEGKEKEYYSMQSIIKRKLVMLSGKKVDEESDIGVEDYRNIVKNMKEASDKVIERLYKKYMKLKRLADKLVNDYELMHIDETKGCYRIHKENFDRTAAPTKAKERFSMMVLSSERPERKVSAISVALETPKRTNTLSSKKRKRRMLEPNEELEMTPRVSIIQEEQSSINT